LIALLLAAAFTAGVVTRVVDGDTVIVKGLGTVRLLGVDTPETHHPTKPVQPCGIEAEAFTRAALAGKRVRLEVTGQDYYGRSLAYVWRGRWLFNRRLIQHGWSIAYWYPHPRRTEFRLLEAEAKLRQVGRWNPNGCASP
jgi:micrococcal nuclease